MGDGQGAEEAYRRELEINPNDFDANFSIGSLRRDEGRFDEALAHLTRAARLRADDLAVLHALASLYLSSGDYQKACDTLEPLVERVPDFQQGHVLLAMAYARLGRMPDAERERAIARGWRPSARRRKRPRGRPPDPFDPEAAPARAAAG
jgi:tetratricopeptide (TPR) repeat protein